MNEQFRARGFVCVIACVECGMCDFRDILITILTCRVLNLYLYILVTVDVISISR